MDFVISTTDADVDKDERLRAEAAQGMYP